MITITVPESTITFTEDITEEEARQRAKVMLFPIRYGRPAVGRNDLAHQINQVESQKNPMGYK